MEKFIKILSKLRHLGVRHLTCGMVSKIHVCTQSWFGLMICGQVVVTPISCFVVSSPKWNLIMSKFVDQLSWLIFSWFCSVPPGRCWDSTNCFLPHHFWFVIQVIILPLLFWCGLCCYFASLSCLNTKTRGSVYNLCRNDTLMMQWSLLSHHFCFVLFHWSDTFFGLSSYRLLLMAFFFFQLKGWKGLKKGREKNRISRF